MGKKAKTGKEDIIDNIKRLRRRYND